MAVTPEETASYLLRRFAARREAPSITHLRELVRSVVPELARAHGASREYLFGSLAWGLADERTDVDLAVEGIGSTRIDGFAGALMMRLPAQVDVVPLEEAPESLRRRITSEAVLLYERRAEAP